MLIAEPVIGKNRKSPSLTKLLNSLEKDTGESLTASTTIVLLVSGQDRIWTPVCQTPKSKWFLLCLTASLNLSACSKGFPLNWFLTGIRLWWPVIPNYVRLSTCWLSLSTKLACLSTLGHILILGAPSKAKGLCLHSAVCCPTAVWTAAHCQPRGEMPSVAAIWKYIDVCHLGNNAGGRFWAFAMERPAQRGPLSARHSNGIFSLTLNSNPVKYVLSLSLSIIYLRFTQEETEALRGWVVCLNSSNL